MFMSVNLKIREQLPDEAIVFESCAYDNSIIGVSSDERVVYSYDAMIEELMKDEDMSYEDAAEWIHYNTIRALPYLGEKAPIIMLNF
jgi:hypothetical protein